MLQAIPIHSTVGIRSPAPRAGTMHDHIRSPPLGRNADRFGNIHDGDGKRPISESGSGFLRGAKPQHAPPRLQKETGCGFPQETAAGDNNFTTVQWLGHGVEIKSDLQLSALGVVFRLATRALNGCFKSAQSTHFIHQTLRIDLPFQTLQGSIDGLAFSNDYFRHKFTYFLKKWTRRVCNPFRGVKRSFSSVL